MSNKGRVVVLEHPLIKHKLTLLRMKETEPWLFRQLVSEITYLMLYEATRDLKTRLIDIETPIATTKSEILDEETVVIPILRAGLGMLDGFTRLMPLARVGFIGLYRDENTLKPIEYYSKFPPLENRLIILADPMLATGGTVVAAIDMIKSRGGERIKFMSILSSPEGIERVQSEHEDVDIYTCAIDERLDENGYIVPGLGDCGDRLFWTT